MNLQMLSRCFYFFLFRSFIILIEREKFFSFQRSFDFHFRDNGVYMYIRFRLIHVCFIRYKRKCNEHICVYFLFIFFSGFSKYFLILSVSFNIRQNIQLSSKK